MEIAYNAGQVTEEVAINKKYQEVSEISKMLFNESLEDKHKFRILFSENLY